MLMDKVEHFDVAIIGGGLAGLALSIQMVRAGKTVILFEKETFPFHKVCGEYISMESWDFLVSLGVDLQSLDLPRINNLLLTAPNGTSLKANLPLGGFGISRYKLDSLLAEIARREGVVLMEATKVNSVDLENDIFTISYGAKGNRVTATICSGAFGKRSNLDVKWKRSFLNSKNKRLDNYVGVKYHVRSKATDDTIALHNFKNGYCGFSKIEGDKYCLCYMTTADTLKGCGNSIPQLQKKVLSKNPELKKILDQMEVLQAFPVTISQINFNKKSAVENGIIMLGDAAGTITPLCGNGMSMALHSSKIAASLIIAFFDQHITLQALEATYSKQWSDTFGKRLEWGRRLQTFFGNTVLSNFIITLCKIFPFIIQPIIRKTHGKPF